eukprot:m.80743 g.80743  ORF g.80743 m.80743 type:complete len:111 (-) comp10930_c0_seq2:999-1331(-)
MYVCVMLFGLYIVWKDTRLVANAENPRAFVPPSSSSGMRHLQSTHSLMTSNYIHFYSAFSAATMMGNHPPSHLTDVASPSPMRRWCHALSTRSPYDPYEEPMCHTEWRFG